MCGITRATRWRSRRWRRLTDAPFNKMRMCVFPKHYRFNQNEPPTYPFEGTPLTDWDFTRFNPAHFRHLEQRVGDLRDLGIEADIILFHPYDRWGFATMDAETDDRYLRYVVARGWQPIAMCGGRWPTSST